MAAAALEKVGVKFPHNGCAATLSALLKLSGIDMPMFLGAGDLALYLEKKRGWSEISVGSQQAGDVGVTFDLTDPPGADHIYLVVERKNDHDMIIADNQSKSLHKRSTSGDGKTPTAYFLRATS